MKTAIDTAPPHPKTLLVGIQAPDNPIKNIESYFDEFKSLVHSSGRDYDEEIFIKLRSIDPATFITKGKIEEIKNICIKNNIEEVIVSEPLSVSQDEIWPNLL